MRLQWAKVASCFLRHYQLIFSLPANNSLPFSWHLKKRQITTFKYLFFHISILFTYYIQKVKLTGIGATRLEITVLSLGPKRKPWSSILSDCLLQNDEELRGAITGSSCRKGDKRGIKMNSSGWLKNRFIIIIISITLMLCLIDLRFDFGMMLPSTTSRAKDFLTFFIGGRCWNEINADLWWS